MFQCFQSRKEIQKTDKFKPPVLRVVVDGFSSTAAGVLASKFHPRLKNFLFSGHQSAVEGHGEMLKALGLTPMIDLGMQLGEGAGVVLGLLILPGDQSDRVQPKT